MSLRTNVRSERFYDYYANKAVEVLFKSETTRMDNWVFDLCKRNAALTGEECLGFKYKAQRYTPTEYSWIKPPRDLPTLSILLSEDVIKFYIESQRIEKDLIQIKQLFNTLLLKCSNRFEIRNVLPECVVVLMDLTAEFPERAYPEGFNLSPMAKLQYDSLLPKIQMYSVIHLINA